jgi:hypothetical protein
VAGLELLRRSHVDQDHVAIAQPPLELGATDHLDGLAEVRLRRALYLGQPAGGDAAQREPELEHVVSRKCVANPEPFALAGDDAGGVQALQVL